MRPGVTDESQMEHGQLRDAAKTVGTTLPVVNSGANSAANVKSESSRPRMREWALPVFLLRSNRRMYPRHLCPMSMQRYSYSPQWYPRLHVCGPRFSTLGFSSARATEPNVTSRQATSHGGSQRETGLEPAASTLGRWVSTSTFSARAAARVPPAW